MRQFIAAQPTSCCSFILPGGTLTGAYALACLPDSLLLLDDCADSRRSLVAVSVPGCWTAVLQLSARQMFASAAAPTPSSYSRALLNALLAAAVFATTAAAIASTAG